VVGFEERWLDPDYGDELVFTIPQSLCP